MYGFMKFVGEIVKLLKSRFEFSLKSRNLWFALPKSLYLRTYMRRSRGLLRTKAQNFSL